MVQSERRGEYVTRGYLLVKDALKDAHGNHLSADAIYALLEARGEKVGRTTVYRQLERLCGEGYAIRTETEGTHCYSVASGECGAHYHLVCTVCGRLEHLSCERVRELFSHIEREHSFRISPARTALYGLCAACTRQSKHKEKQDAHA